MPLFLNLLYSKCTKQFSVQHEFSLQYSTVLQLAAIQNPIDKMPASYSSLVSLSSAAAQQYCSECAVSAWEVRKIHRRDVNHYQSRGFVFPFDGGKLFLLESVQFTVQWWIISSTSNAQPVSQSNHPHNNISFGLSKRIKVKKARKDNEKMKTPFGNVTMVSPLVFKLACVLLKNLSDVWLITNPLSLCTWYIENASSSAHGQS